MLRLLATTAVLVTVWTSRDAHAAPGRDPAVAEVPLEGENIDPAFMERLNRALRAQVQRLGAVTVGFDEVKAAHDASPCGGEVACLARLGARLGADNVLSGRVGMAGNRMQIALQVVEVGSGTQRREVRHSMSVEEAEDRVRALAVEALAMETWVKSAPLVVRAPLTGAQVLVDGVPQGTTPLFGPLALAPGRREVEVRAEGMKSWRGFVDLTFDTPTTVTLDVHEGAIMRSREAPERPPSVTAQAPDKTPLLVTGVGVAVASLAAGVGAAIAWTVASDTHARVYEDRQLALVDDHKSAVTAYTLLAPTAVVGLLVGGGLVGSTFLE